MRAVLLIFAVWSAGLAQDSLQPVSCLEEASLPPPASSQQATIGFVNHTAQPVRVYIRNESRHRLLAGTVGPGERFSQSAPAGQPFVVADGAGRCLGVYRSSAKAAEANIAATSAPAALGTGPIIDTVAGTDWTFPGDGKQATDAPLGFPVSVAADSNGNAFLADEANRMVMRVNRDGTVRVIAGNGILGVSGDGGDARNAAVGELTSIALGADGTVYIALFGGTIRKVSPSGIITTVARLGLTSGPGIGGQGQAISVDAAGNIYFADFTTNRIRRISPSGAISTFAGTGQAGYTGDGGQALAATFRNPQAVRVDTAGNVLIADSGNHVIRRVDTRGVISTVATKTALIGPFSVDLDSAGNLFVLDGTPAVVKKIATDGTVTTLAGTLIAGFSGDGGPANRAQLNNPSALALDIAGSILISDNNNGRVRVVTPDLSISTLAGNGLYRFTPEGTRATLGYFRSLYGIAFDPSGRLYIADRDAARIKRVETNGNLTTVAGNGQALSAGNGPLPATSTPLLYPVAPAVDKNCNLFFIEGSGIVRKVTPLGTMTTYAGGGAANPGDGGPATSALLQLPQALTVDAAGNLYIAEDGTSIVRKVTLDGKISTVAGNGTSGFSGDNGPATKAQLNYPLDMTVDPAGNLYIMDAFNFRIRKVDTNGVITTVAGGGTKPGDGVPATQASLFLLYGLTSDAAGNLYVAESLRNVVRVISPDGIIRNLAGNSTAGFSGDGGPATLASLNLISGLATDPGGDVSVADSSNFRVRAVSDTLPAFTLSPSSLAFTVTAGAASPAPRQVTLSSTVTGLPFTVTASTQSGGNWLVTSGSNTVMPATLNVTVNPANLQPGTYQGTITITPSVANVAAQSVAVSLVVQPAAPSPLAVDVAGLTFSVVRGVAAVTKRVQVVGGGNFSATPRTDSGGNWLSVSPSQGNASAAAPVALDVTANPAGLPAGTYSGRITLINATATVTVPVTMTVSASGQLIRLSQVGLTFNAVVGGGDVPSQSITVLNRGQGAFSFTTSVILPSDVPAWLKVTPATGISDVSQTFPALTISVNPAGLTAGDYYGRIEVSSPTADNSPQDATIVLHLLGAGSNLAPTVQPAGLVFTGVAGGGNPSSQTVFISNLTSASLTYGSSVATLDGGKYITYQPVSAIAAPGTSPVVVQPSFTGLAAGIYRGAIVFIFSDGTVQTVAILIVIAPAGTQPGTVREATGCTPTQLLPLITSLGSSFSVPASFPNTIAIHVVDDCGSAINSGSVVASFSNGDAPLSLNSTGSGDWATTWVSRSTQSQVTITGTASIPQPALTATVQLTGGLSASTAGPAIAAGGVLNASSFATQTPVAPGGMVAIFGSGLGNGTASAPSLPLGGLLAGAQIVVAGRVMPLLYSSGGQVNAILPLGTPVNTPVQMIATNGKQYSVPEEISVSKAQPGVFTVNGLGSGQGHIYVTLADGSGHLAGSSDPAKAGDALVIYCSGLGAVDQPLADGAPAPLSPLAQVVNPVTVTIGGVSTRPFFAGLTPGFAGLYQVNVIVPPGVPPGSQVPLVITMDTQSSPAVTLAVR